MLATNQSADSLLSTLAGANPGVLLKHQPGLAAVNDSTEVIQLDTQPSQSPVVMLYSQTSSR